jgi:beta-phosphoglucomutase-like phosphatase (HAD superfamily)
MIGDQERDVHAGRAAGCRTVLVTRDAELAQRVQPTEVAGSFQDAVRLILQKNGRASNHARIGTRLPREPVPRASTLQQTDGASARNEQSSELAGIRKAVLDLAEEIRSDRLRRTEFTSLRMVAGVCQLLALLLALLGMLQLSHSDVFLKWMIGAGLVQLVTITFLILDLKA